MKKVNIIRHSTFIGGSCGLARRKGSFSISEGFHPHTTLQCMEAQHEFSRF